MTEATTNPWGLTDRELTALSLRGELGPVKLVARSMGLADQTVKAILANAFRKMEARCSVQAVVQLARWKWEQEQSR